MGKLSAPILLSCCWDQGAWMQHILLYTAFMLLFHAEIILLLCCKYTAIPYRKKSLFKWSRSQDQDGCHASKFSWFLRWYIPSDPGQQKVSIWTNFQSIFDRGLALPLDVIIRLYSLIVPLPETPLYYFSYDVWCKLIHWFQSCCCLKVQTDNSWTLGNECIESTIDPLSLQQWGSKTIFTH